MDIFLMSGKLGGINLDQIVIKNGVFSCISNFNPVYILHII